MAAVAGTTYVKVDGNLLTLGGSVTLVKQPIERTLMDSVNGPAGHKEKVLTSSVEVEIYSMAPGTDIQTLYSVKDSTVTVELVNGEVWTFPNAFQEGVIEEETTDGKATVKFMSLLPAERTSGPTTT